MDIAFCKKLTRELMDDHGLHDWKLQFRNLKRLCGYCRYGTKTIALSKFFVENNDIAAVYDLVKHEIAHALVGPGHRHNHVWKAKARELGCRPVRCAKNAIMPAGKYQAVCPTCKKQFHMHRRPKHGLSGYYCRACGQVKGTLVYKVV